MKTPLLEIRGLCKDFPAAGLWGKPARVIDNVNMAVQPGEILGIVGESGSGKTTLARCSLRLIEPTAGSIYFNGTILTDLRDSELRKRRREFQMVFQDPYASLNPAMTIEEILLEPLQVYGTGTPEERRSLLSELIHAVSLDPSMMLRKPAELSGGQQQRVGIARGLALKPRLLVADEPVSALDVSVQAQILNLLSEVKRQYDLTLILISHSLYAIHYLCTRVSVMYRGRIVEEASSAVFFKGPRHPYSLLLLQSLPSLDGRSGSNAIPVEKDLRPPGFLSGCMFQPNCPHRMRSCSESAPPLKEIAPGEKVACFLY